MPTIRTTDGVDLYYEASGHGPPLVFAHESAADARQWQSQVEALSGRYRCIVYNARGYPPSQIPLAESAYGYERAWQDLAEIVARTTRDGAHIVGLSMGAYAGLMLAIHRPDLTRSLFLAGCGTGSKRINDSQLSTAMALLAETYETKGAEAGAMQIAKPRNRQGFRERDPVGWQAWYEDLLTHSAQGMARTFRNVQGQRPSLYEFEDQLKQLRRPVMLAVGDEDDGCLEVNLFLKRTLPHVGLWVLPHCGHAANLEAPDSFNLALLDHLGRAAGADG